MMKQILLMTCAATLAVFAMPVHADGSFYPGDMAKGKTSWRDSHVITAASSYIQIVSKQGEWACSAEEWAAAREGVKKAVLEHPDEINDSFHESGTDGWSALSIAVKYNDYELTAFLLEQGAFPFFSSGREMQKRLKAKETDERIRKALLEAQAEYDLLEAVIASRATKRQPFSK